MRIVHFVVLLVAALGACAASKPESRATMIEAAFQRLAAYKGSGMEEDLNGALDHSEGVLLDDGQSGHIFVCHIFWTVAVCSMDRDLNVREVQSFQANLGFSIAWYQGLVVTFHEHPGTGMFCDTRRSVAVDNGKLVVGEPVTTPGSR